MSVHVKLLSARERKNAQLKKKKTKPRKNVPLSVKKNVKRTLLIPIS